MTKYLDIGALKQAYADGKNIIATINEKYGLERNSTEAIETSYDLQAGSYISFFEKNTEFTDRYTGEQARHILAHFPGAASILDCGCGELTNTASLFSKLATFVDFSAFDVSWSRVFVGREYFRERTSADLFVADMAEIPLADDSVDVVLTSHALEPNHGREHALIAELLRVSRLGIVLCEPSYELGSDEQRARMETHGYIRGLPQILAETGHDTVTPALMDNSATALNRTAVYVVKKRSPVSPVKRTLVDPLSKTELALDGSFYFSPRRGVLYPVVRGIPVLRASAQVLATAFDR